MRQSRYLNAILTVNAVLLAGVLWTSLADTTPFVRSAVAQATSRPRPSGLQTPPVPNIPNASAQRYQTINELREIKSILRSIRQELDATEFDVRVTNVNEFNKGN